MEMSGEYRIRAPRQRVWEGLNDPEVLKTSIPGCESLERTGDNEFTAKVKAKVGPVSARFTGVVTLSDLNPPESYRISGEGKGGAAGFAKGGASVKLTEDAEGTLLRYEAEGQVGGKLAQVGARLIDGTAKKMADTFFASFAETMQAPAAETSPPAAQPEAPSAAESVEDLAAGTPPTVSRAAKESAAAASPPEPSESPEATAPGEPAREATAPRAAPQPEKGLSFPARSPEGEGTRYGVWVIGGIIVLVIVLAIAVLS